ncbi:probable protein phosphatase 2C T23F11.1 [Scaptodrosophila lebanonensis]|uniref:protein-serine/threonine phosphatase n=1 Tax=Drosophila lebanonensis TaxID=7225 RepID=A0A6J2TVS3_DROLE|nr:probable protein phosphatase 2C T23F11.1 [Scaptodrosophila lebanonensis]
MGQTLSEPMTVKDSASCQNSFFRVGSSCMQGWRVEMEDCHTHILALPEDPSAAFFGVYDGHGGSAVAKYAGKHLHKFVTKRAEYLENPELALKKAFLDFDHEMLHNGSWGEQMAGSTAVVVLIKNNRLYCANAGDSRAIACVAGTVHALSVDHKPNDEAEAKRIVAGGGWVEFNRVNGNLALSRALGDFMYKRNNAKKPEEQIVTAYPDVEVRDITEDWEFIFLACDGIWDVMSSSEAAQFVRKRIGAGMSPELICEEIMNNCLAPDGHMGGIGGDNMTAVLVCFLHNKTYEDLTVRCGGVKKPTAVEKVGDVSLSLGVTSKSQFSLTASDAKVSDGIASTPPTAATSPSTPLTAPRKLQDA